MRRNLSTKRTTLADADAVIVVSSMIARDLIERAPGLRQTRIEQIPNAVDIDGIRVAASGARMIDEPYLLFSGKLETNKGADLLVRVVRDGARRLPLVVIGDGALRASIEREARATGLDVRVTGWLRREDALRWVAHASALVFPSRGPESLSRVLLEAAALGVPIAAMDTGGTSRDRPPRRDGPAVEDARFTRERRGEADWRHRVGRAARGSPRALTWRARSIRAQSSIATVMLYSELVSRKQQGASRA